MKLKCFVREIGIPEFKSVIGKWGSKIFFLILILFISLIAMGIANGSLEYLKEKMNDPFMQFVDVDHRWDGAVKGFPEFNKVIADQYKDDNQNKVKSVFETHVKSERFFNKNLNDAKTKEGFILDTDNDFYKSLINKDLFLTNKNSFHNNQWGVIITERFMNQLGLDLSSPYINIQKGNNTLPIPICGIVKKLRNNKEFIMSKKLYSLLYGNSEKISVLKSDTSQGVMRWFLPGVLNLSGDLISRSITKTEIYAEQSLPHSYGLMVETPDFSNDLSNIGAVRVYDYNVLDLDIEQNIGAPDTYTFLFRSPDDVLSFDSWIEEKYGIDLEESRMEAKRNFGFFENLSKLLSFALIAFSIISIIFFIINLLLSHINKNKRNLGTLKAFGLPNKHIIILYSTITLLLVTISYISAYVLSDLLGQVVLDSYIAFKKISLENYLNYVVFDNENFINVFGLFVLLPTTIIITVLFIYLYKVTPGDLIYERK